MAIEVYSFQVNTPAGTTQAAPLTTPITLPVRRITRLTVRVPPGPQGVLGWRLTYVGQTVIPVNAAQWIVTDNEVIVWDVTGLPTAGSWQVQSYNTGQYDHAIMLRFEVELVTGPTGQSPIAGVSNAELAAVPDAALAVTSDTPPIDLTGLTLTVPDTLNLAGM